MLRCSINAFNAACVAVMASIATGVTNFLARARDLASVIERGI
jgi:hypothetical protein